MGERRKGLNSRGWTLVELMIVTAIIGVITPAMTMLFSKCAQGMAADEMHIQLESLNSLNLLRIHERATASRHLLEGDASGTAFLQAVTQGMSAATKSNYPILAGTLLPTTQSVPVSSFASFSTAAGGAASNFGNSLLFGAYDMAQTINNVTYVSPVTVFTKGACPVTFLDSKPATIVVDLYRFYYYYLTSNNPKSIKGASSYRLVEWQSVQFADYYQLLNLSKSTLGGPNLMKDVVTWLATTGNAGTGIAVTLAWDPTQTDPTNGTFYTLTTAGAATSITNPSIPEGQVLCLTKVPAGVLSTGFGYGVSPNTAGWADAPPVVSPRYATANGSFPGGFEVGISGTGTGRQVFTRSFIVAKGASPRVVYNEGEMIHNLRDSW